MHICLPDTREVKPPHGSAFLLYNVHIDGLYHCSLRFKQLLHLHQALSKQFTSSSPHYSHQLPPFPPKKFLPLSVSQVEERRTQLEKYLQNISQDKAICNSSIFNLFLLEAQRESTRIRENQVHLDIELVNGQKIRLQIVTHDSADAILTAVCRALGLDDRYHAYFCLCLCGYDVIRDKLIIKRRLSFFEAPFITLQMAIQQQEQLQNVLQQASSYSTITSNGNNNNNNNNANNGNCRCLSCSNQQAAANLQLQSNSTGVPSICSSSGTGTSYVQNNNNNHIMQTTGHSNQSDGNNNNNHRSSSSSSPYQYQQYNQQQRQGCCYQNQNKQQSSTTTTTTSFVTHRILLRKSYWDPIYDTYILNDHQALNLLFIQTVYDIKHSLMFVNREIYHQLESLLAADSKLEYILLARTLKYYNYVHFEPCLSDYPRPRTKVMISIGSKELNMRVLKSPKSIVNGNGNSTLQQQSSASASAMQSSLQTTQLNNNSAQPAVSPAASSNQQQQVSASSEQVLYCTSSLVPSGYQHLITKEDLVEEEYNFKVPLIRCWRLTSLETLNSNNGSYSGGPSPIERQRKSLSLFGLSNNENRLNESHHHQNNHNHNHNHSNGSSGSSAGLVSNTGSGGSSLMAALTGRNGFCRPAAKNNNNQQQQQHQYCQHENHRCGFDPTAASMMLAKDPHSQFSQYELSFEYLVSKDTLKWITISSDQAIFISISLQGVVDELVSKRNGKSSSSLLKRIDNNHQVVTSPTNTVVNNNMITNNNIESNNNNNSACNTNQNSSFTYMFRDGSQKLMKTSNQQLIDKFGTTLGYSPSVSTYALALARQRHQQQQQQQQQQLRASSSAALFLASSRLSSTTVAVFDAATGGGCGATGSYPRTSCSSFEITNLKKAPSPIINDAFEGVTNEDDL